ncbi:hypothetical protein Asi02nite_71530 [Asanoa siamensis]|uniref:Uncharacterized protein n=1 Tax=Asanoa siamensis TaxID=926357 RepID=A0ABQ4D2A6_9ACTN|nr:hypothetical protein Asi02nite_71530 [Asanoa siamensis]
MQVCAPPRQSARRIGSKSVRISVADRDEPQKLVGWRTLPATHAGALRPRTSSRRQVYSYAPAGAPPGSVA